VANVVAGVLVVAAAPPTVTILFDDAAAAVAEDDAPAAEQQQLAAGFPQYVGVRDPDQRCGTCAQFNARDGVCQSSGPWGNCLVTAGSPSCDWYDPVRVGEEADLWAECPGRR